MNDFLITYKSNFPVKEMIDRIENILREKNVTIFARISHSEAAKKAGLTMQDEELIIFGNPKVGTALMVERPAIGIELPLKIIAWRQSQETIVAYHNLDLLAKMFTIKSSQSVIIGLKEFLKNLVETIIR